MRDSLDRNESTQNQEHTQSNLDTHDFLKLEKRISQCSNQEMLLRVAVCLEHVVRRGVDAGAGTDGHCEFAGFALEEDKGQVRKTS